MKEGRQSLTRLTNSVNFKQSIVLYYEIVRVNFYFQFPDHGYVAIADKIVLFVEEKSSNSDVLKRLDNIEQLKDGSVILVVLSGNDHSNHVFPVMLNFNSYV